MNLNYENKTIEMTKNEAKKAGDISSSEYAQLATMRASFPNYEIVIKKATKRRETFKGLSYAYMENYIKTNANDENKNSLLEEFYTMRGYVNGKKNDFVDQASYGEIKNWFLLNFPEIAEFNKKVEDLRNKTRFEFETLKKAS